MKRIGLVVLAAVMAFTVVAVAQQQPSQNHLNPE